MKKRKVSHARRKNAEKHGSRKGPVRSRRVSGGAAPVLPPSARLEKHSAQLFRACSIVEACYRATASLYPLKDPESIVPALEAAHEMIGDVAGEIDEIAEHLSPKRRARLAAR